MPDGACWVDLQAVNEPGLVAPAAAECVEQVGIPQPPVSVHLSCLPDCGYVTARRDDRKLRYSVGDPRVADLVTLARALAADNATALDCCPGIPAPPGTETE